MKLLDHGYLKFVDKWGSDEAIIEAARLSTQKGFQGWGDPDRLICTNAGCLLHASPLAELGSKCEECGSPVRPNVGDEKLLKFLYDNKHATPFEFAGLVIEVQAPIMVFREWHRHRTQSYNEASARYAPLPPYDYVPTAERVLQGLKPTANKQAGAMNEGLTPEIADEWIIMLEQHYNDAENFYQWGLNRGIPKELARLGMPVGRYSRMRACCNLRNWLGFMTLRSSPNAQYEIRVFSDAVGKIIAETFPRTWKLFATGRKS